ncbi:MAG: YIP1 family protein [Anaerolineae bacterium]|nr:YIP1 family protein [Anaerolineae bacterium]
MTDEQNSIDTIEEVSNKPLHFEWMLPIWLHPRRTLEEISRQEKAVWLAPLLVLSLLVLLNVLISGPARAASVQVAAPSAENMQYYTQEQVTRFEQSADQSRGPLFIYIFPAVLALGGVWLSWVLLGSLLHFALTLSGSRNSHVMTLNLVAWCSLPLALRFAIQALYTLVSQRQIQAQGLSGFVAADGGFSVYLNALLAQMDVYGLGLLALLLVGVPLFSHLNRQKAWAAALVCLLVMMSLASIPALIGAQLSGLSGSGGVIPFF